MILVLHVILVLLGPCAPCVPAGFSDVRMIGYVQVEMCEWSGHNVRVNMDCANRVMCE